MLFLDLGQLLIGRFKERDERVRYDVFQGYAALLKHTRLYLPDSVVNTAYTPRHTSPPYSEQKFRAVLRDELGEEQRRVFEALETQIPQLMRAINRQLKAKNLKTRRDCFVLLSHLLKHVEKAFPSALKGYFAELTGPIQASMADKASDGNMKISTLHFVKVALHTHEPATLYPHLPVLSALITDAVKDSLCKIAAEALIAVQCLIRVLRPQIGEEQFDFTPFVPSIHDAIHFKLKIADIDREVKERTVVATGVFIATFADKLTVAQLRGSLALLLDRLRNETTRHVTVKALKTVVRSPLRIDLSAILPEVLPLMADFLRKNQRALKISTLTLLALLVAKFARGGLENRGLTRVAEEVPALIREKDPQISQLSLKFMADLISAYPDQLSDSLQSLLAAVVTITQSSLLQGATLQAALGLLAALVKSPLPKKPSFEALLDRLTSAVYNGQTLHRQAYVSIAKCVAIVALATADMGKTVKLIVQLKGLVTPGQTDSIHLFAVLAIAEIGRIYSALYGKQAARVQPEQVMVGTFGSYSEEVRTAASYTFGSLAVGNLSEYLQFILKGINEDPARRYSLLRTLKEIIISESVSGAASDVFREKVGEIWTVLIGQCDSEEEGTLNVAAECLGELCLVNPQSFLVGMIECVKGMSERMCATAVTAIHFVIADHPMPIGEHLRQVMGQLEIIHESDHHVRRVAMVALNSAAHYKLRMGPRSSSDALRDVFAFGNRFMLDALQIVTRHFDSVVLSMCNVCLRRIDHIWLTHNSYIAVSDERTLSWEWTSDDGGVPRGRSEEISASLRSSLIAHFDIRDLRPTNAFCSIVSEHASHTDIGQLHFQSTDWTNADDHAVALLIGSFASIDRLSFFECTFSSAQVTDDFIRTCIAKRTSDVRISKTKWRSGETRSFSITNDAIMHFCTAPVGGTRMLVADSIPSTEGLFRRIVEAAILGRLTDFIMSLKVADAQNFYNMRDFPTLNVRMEFNRRDHTMRVRSYGRNPVVGEGSVLSGQPI